MAEGAAITTVALGMAEPLGPEALLGVQGVLYRPFAAGRVRARVQAVLQDRPVRYSIGRPWQK